MTLFTFYQWIEATSLSTAIREGALYYPILGAFHMIGIGWFGGMVLMGDLSVLGIGLRDMPASELFSQFRRWKWAGFAVMLISGGLLWWSEPIVCAKSVSFKIKLVLLVLLGLNSLVFRKRSSGARLAACLSLLLWFGLILTGRGIAFL